MNNEILTTVKNYLRSAVTGAMIVCVLLVTGLSPAANAQPFSTGNNHPEIKYLGTIDDKMVFQVDLENVPANQYVSIRDEEGNTLYTERIGNTKFSRKFAFEKEEFEGKKVSFVIHGGKASTDLTFQVSRNTRLVEDLVITKL